MDTEAVYGVELNPIIYRRTALDFDAAVAVWLMRMRGAHFATSAQKLGTNPARVGEVLRKERHPDAYEVALGHV